MRLLAEREGNELGNSDVLWSAAILAAEADGKAAIGNQEETWSYFPAGDRGSKIRCSGQDGRAPREKISHLSNTKGY